MQLDRHDLRRPGRPVQTGRTSGARYYRQTETVGGGERGSSENYAKEAQRRPKTTRSLTRGSVKVGSFNANQWTTNSHAARQSIRAQRQIVFVLPTHVPFQKEYKDCWTLAGPSSCPKEGPRGFGQSRRNDTLHDTPSANPRSVDCVLGFREDVDLTGPLCLCDEDRRGETEWA